MNEERNRVCPVELADSLDGRLRGWLQNPGKILAPYVREGMTVLDVGCGPGFYSIEMARMVGVNGKVIAADLQEGMIEKLRNKIRGSALEGTIATVRCGKDAINVSDPIDFGLAFYMVHEVPDKAKFFTQIHAILKGDGRFLVVEPKLFHVSRKEFAATTAIARQCGFDIDPGPRLPFSWSAILSAA